MLSLLILAIACLPQFISSSNLALTFDAANSTCTAACTTCSDTSNTDTNQYNTDDGLLNELLNATRNNGQDIQEVKQKMDGIISSLSHIKETATSNAGAINDILLLVEDLIMLHNDSSSFSPIPTSCQEIKNKQPNSPSGVYLLATNDGTQYVYCNMEELCGSGGGWTRIGYLDMSDATQSCPGNLATLTYQGVRYCRRPGTEASCSSVSLWPNGVNYTQICGRITAFQYANTDANHPQKDLDSIYVDGISITRGSPRKHVWTLMSALFENILYGIDICPCFVGSTIVNQSFIGNDYYCESGNPDSYYQSGVMYPNDPLWDGKQCAPLESPCCTNPNLPWFHKTLANSTSDFIEMRLCGDERPYAEDTPISFYEIYIK